MPNGRARDCGFDAVRKAADHSHLQQQSQCKEHGALDAEQYDAAARNVHVEGAACAAQDAILDTRHGDLHNARSEVKGREYLVQRCERRVDVNGLRQIRQDIAGDQQHKTRNKVKRRDARLRRGWSIERKRVAVAQRYHAEPVRQS